MLNNHKKGSKRDKSIFDLLESQVSLNTDMIRLLLFKHNCLRIVQRRLTKLSTPPNAKIKRERLKLSEPYYYFMDRKPGQIEHVLGVSWVYTWIGVTLSNMEKIHCFDREVKEYKSIRPDAFAGIKNLWQDAYYFFFIEMDIARSGNDFGKKAKKYNDIFNSGSYMNMWWVPLSKRFPVIIVVTTGSVKNIREKIEKENINDLEFRVYSLEQIKEECLNGRSSSKSLRS
jgi:hypothetical protein